MTAVQNTLQQKLMVQNLKRRYSKFIKVLFFLGIILFFWVVIDYIGIAFWGYGYNWAILGLEEWSIVAASIIAFFILLEIVLYVMFLNTKKIVSKIKKKATEFIDGKKVYTYTYPEGVEGGIYSKTYISIDGRNILRLRSLMIEPDELWGSKKGKDIE